MKHLLLHMMILRLKGKAQSPVLIYKHCFLTAVLAICPPRKSMSCAFSARPQSRWVGEEFRVADCALCVQSPPYPSRPSPIDAAVTPFSHSIAWHSPPKRETMAKRNRTDARPRTRSERGFSPAAVCYLQLTRTPRVSVPKPYRGVRIPLPPPASLDCREIPQYRF